MTTKITTLGCSGHDVNDLREHLETQDALLFDIRYRTRSHKPDWNEWALRAKLDDRYTRIPELGDRNYLNGGPPEIVDLDAGVRRILDSEQPIVLMCECHCPRLCHRSMIAEQLAAMGIRTAEWDWEGDQSL